MNVLLRSTPEKRPARGLSYKQLNSRAWALIAEWPQGAQGVPPASKARERAHRTPSNCSPTFSRRLAVNHVVMFERSGRRLPRLLGQRPVKLDWHTFAHAGRQVLCIPIRQTYASVRRRLADF